MRIHRIQGIMAASYLIEADGLVLVDAGFLGTGHLVTRAIRSLGRDPEELRLVLVTHPHLDHFGGLAGLRHRLDFDIGTHPDALRTVAEGGKEFSPGHTPFARWVAWLARTSLPHLTFRGASPIRAVWDGMPLHDLGLPGRVVYTPGHTESCVSLVLDDGTAITGDLVQGRTPLVRRPTPPSMAWSLGAAFDSWRMLLSAGVERFLPAHGGAFSADELRRALVRAQAHATAELEVVEARSRRR